jgi:hypothetical protein
MEFFTGAASTEGDPWSKVSGDRFSASELKKEDGSYKTILSISGAITAHQTIVDSRRKV